MTCGGKYGCGFEFCWICLGDWNNHNNCDIYDSNEK
jgi:hypothetical protein